MNTEERPQRRRHRIVLRTALCLSAVVLVVIGAALAYRMFSRAMGAITENSSRGPIRDLYDRVAVEVGACEYSLRTVPALHSLDTALDRIRAASLMVERITTDLAALQDPDSTAAQVCLSASGAFVRRAATMKVELIEPAVRRAASASPTQAELESALDDLCGRLKEFEAGLSDVANGKQ